MLFLNRCGTVADEAVRIKISSFIIPIFQDLFSQKVMMMIEVNL